MKAIVFLILFSLFGCTSNKNIPKEDSNIKWLSLTKEVISALAAEKVNVGKSYSDPTEITFIKRPLNNRFLGETKLVSIAYDFAGKDEKYPQQLTWIEYQFGDGFKKPTAIFSGAVADFGKPEFDIHRYSGAQIMKASNKAIRFDSYQSRIAVWRLGHTTIQLIWDGDNETYEYRLEMFYDPTASKLAELNEEKKNFVEKGLAVSAPH